MEILSGRIEKSMTACLSRIEQEDKWRSSRDVKQTVHEEAVHVGA